jgi:hypothetical protein
VLFVDQGTGKTQVQSEYSLEKYYAEKKEETSLQLVPRCVQ